jgi:hypothetical protein
MLMPQFRAIHIVLPAVVGGWLGPAALLACNVPFTIFGRPNTPAAFWK